MRISDWSSDVCSSDLGQHHAVESGERGLRIRLRLLDARAADQEVRPAPRDQRAERKREGIAALHLIVAEEVAGTSECSEARRVGKEGVSTFKSGWSQILYTTTKNHKQLDQPKN